MRGCGVVPQKSRHTFISLTSRKTVFNKFKHQTRLWRLPSGWARILFKSETCNPKKAKEKQHSRDSCETPCGPYLQFESVPFSFYPDEEK